MMRNRLKKHSIGTSFHLDNVTLLGHREISIASEL
jgi:hypothetical protein